MDECNPKEKELGPSGIAAPSVFTGGDDSGRQLLPHLRESLRRAEGIDIIVSFLMESGVKAVIEELEGAVKRGVPVRILTGDYLGITQPSALYLLKSRLKDKVDLRFYSDKSRAFHPKTYILHHSGFNEVYIGSSNLSLSALTKGVEWNYRFSDDLDKKSYDSFYATFLDLFNNHSIIIDDKELRRYSKSWRKPSVFKDIERVQSESGGKAITFFEPRGMQIEALYALENMREEGATRALVNAATGVGKTYLAAFDSKGFKRVLFVAHREEILKQAARSFRNVRGSDDFGFFDSKVKEPDKSVVFASVQTLGKEESLKSYFKPDDFDYIVIDEFHHAVTKRYQTVIDYFKPSFLLGLTATPERMDARNIYEICDYNVAYEIELKEAINKGILVPFHYYGIYDETDYTHMKVSKGRYSEAELDNAYIGNIKRSNLIFKHYKKHKSKMALGFCSSKRHAEAMAEAFIERGVPAAAVYSGSQGPYAVGRDEALRRLERGELKVVFSVDMFNEGVDIQGLDMVMFLRPTESPTVFMQQLGRGLRTSKGKSFLTVLDFIGNFKNASLIPSLLRGWAAGPKGELEYPEGCEVDFDLNLIDFGLINLDSVDLFSELAKKPRQLRQMAVEEYYRIKADLGGERPTRMDLFVNMNSQIYDRLLQKPKINPFRDYLGFLEELGELTEGERKVYNSVAREFLTTLEQTQMVKVNKMPVLRSFYNGGNIKMALTDGDLLNEWKGFFSENANWRDYSGADSLQGFLEMPDKVHLNRIKSKPVKHLKASGKGFFTSKEGYRIALSEELEPFITDPFFVSQFKDIIDYRVMDYYKRRYRKGI